MNRAIKAFAASVGWIVGVAVVCVPLSLIITFLAHPFWRASEAWTGVESAGHSGPAEWCYVATWAAMTVLGAFTVLRCQHPANGVS